MPHLQSCLFELIMVIINKNFKWTERLKLSVQIAWFYRKTYIINTKAYEKCIYIYIFWFVLSAYQTTTLA